MTGEILNKSQAAELCELVSRYKDRVTLGPSWKKRSAEDLWLKVLAQVVVVGKAAPGYVVQDSIEARKYLSFAKLSSIHNNPRRLLHIHKILRILGVRYVSKNLKKDKKSKAVAENLCLLLDA